MNDIIDNWLDAALPLGNWRAAMQGQLFSPSSLRMLFEAGSHKTRVKLPDTLTWDLVESRLEQWAIGTEEEEVQ